MKISGFKRLVKEDFNETDQALVEKLAYVFNPFQEQVYYAFNNGITITDNLNAITTTYKAKVDANGVPSGNNQVKYTLKTRPKGAMVINARSTDGSLLSGSPFITFNINNDIITITQITGLLAGKEYELTIVFLGT